jgi:hypothetical protein
VQKKAFLWRLAALEAIGRNVEHIRKRSFREQRTAFSERNQTGYQVKLLEHWTSVYLVISASILWIRWVAAGCEVMVIVANLEG